MITAEQQDIVKNILKNILNQMGMSADIETETAEDTLVFNLKTVDSAMLIGQHGVNLGALQYLTRLLVHKQLSEQIHFVVDVEGYKKSREAFLRELARQAAARVRDTKESLLLKPMASYERRVVHAEISKLPDIVTESVGEEPERRILIKPKPQV
jgi:spoIIIJ-associated protein